ncbi:MAG: tetratricopeptide repeat protein [Pseudomonadota bacterium]
MLKHSRPETAKFGDALRKSLSLAAGGQVDAAAEAAKSGGLFSPAAAEWLKGESVPPREQALWRALARLSGFAADDPRQSLARAEVEHICGRQANAVALCEKALANPATAGEAHALAGHCLTAIGDKRKAIEAFTRAVQVLPRRGDLHGLLGALLLGAGEAGRAVEALGRAIALDGRDWNAWFELGNAHKALGDKKAAIDAFSRSIEINPRNADSFNNRGATLQVMGADQQAIADFDNAISLNRAHLFAWMNKGVSLGKLDRQEDSVKAFETALAVNPAMGEAYHNLGLTLLKLERNSEALRNLEAALLVEPARTDWLLSKGNALGALFRYEEAVAAYRDCIAGNPANTDARINMAGALQELAEHDKAIAILDDALAKRPGYPEAQWNRANSLLAFGPSREAWEAYEQRLHLSVHEKLPDYGLPLLGTGEIKGRKLLVQWEQRFGDVLQMLRYIPEVSKQCAAHWQVAPPLLDLVKASFPDIAICGREECPPGLDTRIPYTSLPLAMKSFALADIPNAAPYLRASEAARNKWAGTREAGRTNVGIAWRGNPQPPGRSVPIEQAAALFDIPDMRFISLQVDPTREEEAVLKRHGVADLGRDIKSFDDSAALLEQLDLIVTIDTAIAHLAGALGRKTFVLLKYGADWRWLLKRSDSPWYPTATLFRQSSLGNWKDVVSAVKERAAELRPDA